MKTDKTLYNDMEETFLTDELQAQTFIGPASQRIMALFLSNSKNYRYLNFTECLIFKKNERKQLLDFQYNPPPMVGTFDKHLF